MDNLVVFCWFVALKFNELFPLAPKPRPTNPLIELFDLSVPSICAFSELSEVLAILTLPLALNALSTD